MESIGKTRMVSPGRSQGDGMENAPFSEVDSSRNWSAVHTSAQVSPMDYHHKHFVPTQGKAKEPKFVPYEPYKAAVSPIVPAHLDKACDPFSKQQSTFVIDSQRVSSLASSIIRMYSSMEKSSDEDAKLLTLVQPEDARQCPPDCLERLRLLEEKVGALEKEKKELMSQYQVQAEVNADLKKMLVASLGEDVQLKVQFMTEDKAALGMEVLRLSEELEAVTEEAERKGVGCDVWESKFKASSLMVKELAQWKSTLSQLLNQSSKSLDGMMQEHESIFEMLSTAHSKLESCLSATVANSKTTTRKDLPPKTMSQLAVEIASLSNKVQERFLGKLFYDTKSTHPRKLTKNENSANQFLKSFERMGTGSPSRTDGDCQVLSHVCSMDASANFCRHCSGEVKLL